RPPRPRTDLLLRSVLGLAALRFRRRFLFLRGFALHLLALGAMTLHGGHGLPFVLEGLALQLALVTVVVPGLLVVVTAVLVNAAAVRPGQRGREHEQSERHAQSSHREPSSCERVRYLVAVHAPRDVYLSEHSSAFAVVHARSSPIS